MVYVAPMKALASEVTSAFQARLAPLGIIVKELTGDTQLTKKELKETQLIVTTPEKCQQRVSFLQAAGAQIWVTSK
jgi:activating signal cointegrator complex subunit 3